MTYDTPLSPRPLGSLADPAGHRLLTARQLRAHGVSGAAADERCRPGGPWRRLLPGVYLLHPGPPTGEERLRAALLYAGGEGAPAVTVAPSLAGTGLAAARPAASPPPAAAPAPAARPAPLTEPARPAIPGQARPAGAGARPAAQPPDARPGGAMLTGLAALVLHGFTGVPPLPALERIDVLVPRGRRARSTAGVRVLRGHALPEPLEATGLPVAPAARALADAVAGLAADAVAVRALLVEAVRAGHCEAPEVLHELGRARLLGRAPVAEAVDALLAEDRALAEGRLYEMVFRHWLPEPCWNVDLRLRGGPHLGGVDAYWPEQAVALELDTRTPPGDLAGPYTPYARKRETLERFGITVVHLTPQRLRDALEQQAAIVRTALVTAAERDPAADVVVLPR